MYLFILLYLFGFIWVRYWVMPDIQFELNHSELIGRVTARVFLGVCFILSPIFLVLGAIGCILLGVCYIVGQLLTDLFEIPNGPPDNRHLQSGQRDV